MEHTKRSQANKEAILTRLNRISGQIEGLKNMVNEDRYCNDILIQIRAVRNSLKSLANLILMIICITVLLIKFKRGT